VLFTGNISGLWEAQQKGLFQPVASAVLEEPPPPTRRNIARWPG
jgi:hypothetical protein